MISAERERNRETRTFQCYFSISSTSDFNRIKNWILCFGLANQSKLDQPQQHQQRKKVVAKNGSSSSNSSSSKILRFLICKARSGSVIQAILNKQIVWHQISFKYAIEHNTKQQHQQQLP